MADTPVYQDGWNKPVLAPQFKWLVNTLKGTGSRDRNQIYGEKKLTILGIHKNLY